MKKSKAGTHAPASAWKIAKTMEDGQALRMAFCAAAFDAGSAAASTALRDDWLAALRAAVAAAQADDAASGTV